MAQREIVARLVTVRNVFEARDLGDAPTVILTVDQCGSELTAKGEAHLSDLMPGCMYRLWGHTVTHHRWGDQFAFATIVREAPSDATAVKAYLQHAPRIGPVTAEKLIKYFGAAAVDILRVDPDSAARAISGLSKEKAAEAAEWLRADSSAAKAKIDLGGVLNGKGIPKKTIDKLLRDYGSAAAEQVRRNPYLLMRYRGVGFQKSDNVYLSLGKDPARLKRQGLCAWNVIARDSSGDTWFGEHTIKQELSRVIDGVEPDYSRATELMYRLGRVGGDGLVCRMDGGRKWIARQGRANAEATIADLLVEAEEETYGGITLWPDVNTLAELSDHQRIEAAKALTGSVISILGGSPGTGKTYTVAAIVKRLLVTLRADQIAVAAPTGKAAVRCSEAMQRNGIDIRATTIHSLLVVESGEDGWTFQHTGTNPLSEQVIIVDESSMIDTDLMRALLSARAVGCHMLFVGDPHQLAPVGHGAPLRDMIAADVPHGILTEIQRNSGRIVRTCAEIRDRQRFSAATTPDLERGENLVLVERDDSSQMETLLALIERIKSKGEDDPIWDVQVICAVNKKSPMARKELNKQLQTLLNAEGVTVAGSPFRVGDKIINTKNGSFDDFAEADRIRRLKLTGEQAKCVVQHYVANGEQGEVLSVEASRMVVRVPSPDRTIVIYRGAAKAKDSDDDSDDDDKTNTGCSWELGYAISCHKSQGSEWPIVIIVADGSNAASNVMTRQWVYTAISRAKRMAVVLGLQETVNKACKRDGLFNRKTFLKEQICERRAADMFTGDDLDSIFADAPAEALS